jgi:tetratricopeptide (TPR) repeat protein
LFSPEEHAAGYSIIGYIGLVDIFASRGKFLMTYLPQMLRYIAFLGVLLTLSIFPGHAVADVLHLKNGRKIRGEIDEKASDAKTLVITLPTGSASVPRSAIKRVEREDKSSYLIRQGQSLSRIGSHGEAIACLREALLLTKNSQEATTALSQALVRRGYSFIKVQAGTAIEDFLEALSLTPNSASAKAALEEAKHASAGIDTLLTKAQSLEKRDINQAISTYEEILKKDPGYAKRIQSPLASLYARQGDKTLQRKIKQNKGIDAATALKAAKSYDNALRLSSDLMDDIAPRWAFTRVILAHSGYKISVKQMTAAASFNPDTILGRCAEAFRLELSGQKKKADALWLSFGDGETVAESQVAAIKGALERLKWGGGKSSRGAGKKSGKWQIYETPHFEIHHRDRAFASKLGRKAEFTYRSAFPGLKKNRGRLLGKIVVKVYRDYTNYVENGGPAGSSGVTENKTVGPGLFKTKIRVYQSSRQLLTSTIGHEVVHALLPVVIGHNKVPHWIHEGLATYYEPSPKQEFYRRKVSEGKKQKRLIPAEQLVKSTSYPNSAQVTLFYGQCLALVRYLVRTTSLRTVIKMVRDLKDTSLADSIYRHFRVKDYSKWNAAFKK